MFNAHLYEVPHWTIDDDTIIGTAANSQRASFMFKKIAANRKGISHAKFQQQAMVEWCGRMGITLNMDATSMRLIGPQDPATLEKNNLYLCNPVRFHYPVPAEVQRILSIELPILARVLLDIEIPPLFEPNNRYGFEPYHDATLLERTNQSNPMAPFKELLIEALIAEFRSTAAPVWKGTLTQIMRLLAQDPRNDNAVRSMKMDQVNRWLEQIQKEKLLKVEVDTAKMNTRVFSFFRTDFQDALTDVLAEPAPILVTSTDNVKNPFEK